MSRANRYSKKRTTDRINFSRTAIKGVNLTKLEKQLKEGLGLQYLRLEMFPKDIAQEISDLETKAVLYNRFRDAMKEFRPGRLGLRTHTPSEYASNELYTIGKRVYTAHTGHPLFKNLGDFDQSTIERYHQHKRRWVKSPKERVQEELIKMSQIHPWDQWVNNPYHGYKVVGSPTQWKKNPYFSYNK